MGSIYDLSRDDEQATAAARRLTGPTAAGGPIARAASMAAPAPGTSAYGNPMDDGSLPSSIRTLADQALPRIAQLSSLDSQAGMIPSNANPNPVQQTPRQIADAAAANKFAPAPSVSSPIAALITARSQNGPTSVPVTPQQTADGVERSADLSAMQAQATRPARGTPTITSLTQQSVEPPAPGSVVSGGDRVYAPNQPAQIDPYKTADGRSLNPNDASMSAADRAAIGQFQASNAQQSADIERQQRSNPLAGAVQIIRPGSEVSYAVQAPQRMVELTAPAYAQYQSAFERNPGMAARAQMTEGGVTVDGQVAPPNIVGYGDDALKTYNANARKDAETGLDAGTLAKIAIQQAENQGKSDVAKIQANGDKNAIVQSDQGTALVDKRTGESTPVTMNGQPLGPKLKDLPAPVQKAFLENSTSLRKLDSALEAINTYPDAFGIKNYLGDAIRQRTDPKGIEGRALVADIGSMKVHDRSGAAVTASETPRLLPFIPSATDDPKTIQKKVGLFKKEIEAMQQDITSTYSSEQGYKPFGSKLPQPAPANPGAQPPKSTPSVSPAHIALLKGNPDKAAEFDAKFGKGASAAILGGRSYADGGLLGEGDPADDDRQSAVQDQQPPASPLLSSPVKKDDEEIGMLSTGYGQPAHGYANGGQIATPNANPYVIPDHVVRKLGTDFFDKLLQKNQAGQ